MFEERRSRQGAPVASEQGAGHADLSVGGAALTGGGIGGITGGIIAPAAHFGGENFLARSGAGTEAVVSHTGEVAEAASHSEDVGTDATRTPPRTTGPEKPYPVLEYGNLPKGPKLIDVTDQGLAEYVSSKHPRLSRDMSNMLTEPCTRMKLFEAPELGDNFHLIWNGSPDFSVNMSMVPQSYIDLPEQTKSTLDRLVAECFFEARQFVNWEEFGVFPIPKGLIVEGSGGFGMEQGNGFGIRVNYKEHIEPLISALERNDLLSVMERLTYMKSSFVHEMTHNVRDDGIVPSVAIEIPAHVMQFLTATGNDPIFHEKILLDGLDEIEAHGLNKARSYAKAAYAALRLVADELAQWSPEVGEMLAKDASPLKITALRKIAGGITPEETAYLRTKMIPDMLNLSEKEIRASVDRVIGSSLE